MSSASALIDGCLGLPPSFFAYMHALVPRVLKPGIAITHTVLEPGTAPTATTHFIRFRNGAAFNADETESRRGSS